MRFALSLLACLLVAAVVFSLWGAGSTATRLPAEGQESFAVVPPAAEHGEQAGANADSPQQRTQVALPIASLPAGVPVARGRLLQQGRALAFARVNVYGMEPVMTDDAGRFAVGINGPKRFLEVTGDSVPEGVRIGPVDMLDLAVRELGDLHVPHAVGVVGRVVDAEGHALANIRVYATRDRFEDGVAHDDLRANLNTLSREDGSFRLHGLRPGEVKVRALLEGHSSQERTVNVLDGVGDVGMVVVRRYADLIGTIVDDAGQPIAQARVTPGGGNYGLEQWAAVETDAEGRFVLVGKGQGWSLTIEKHGYARTLVDRVYRLPRPLRIAMQDALPLHGHVSGLQGKPAEFFVDEPKGDYRATPGWVSAYSWTAQPIAADGEFSLPHLPAGKWVIRVRAPGRGSIADAEFQIPLAQKLELQLTPNRILTLTIVDEVGEAIPGAQVRRVDASFNKKSLEQPLLLSKRWFDWPRGETFAADEEGRVQVSVSRTDDVCVAVRAPMHMPTALGFVCDEVPEADTVMLPRAGYVIGKVLDASLTTNVQVSVAIRPLAEDAGPGTTRPLDAIGRFRAGPLPPGDYDVGLMLHDKSHFTLFTDHELPVAKPVPLIHNYDMASATVRVTVVAGQEVEVLVPAARVGEVRGRVLAGARPIPGAIVYAEEVKEASERDRLFDEELGGLDAHRYAPSCRTDELGQFRFLISAEKLIRIRARRESAGGWCEPVELAVSPRSDINLPDIVLSASTIRGSYDLTTVDPAQRQFVAAQLYTSDKAADDPFYHTDYSVPIEWQSQRQDIGVDGSFAFEGVGPGTWVLRIVTGLSHVAVQRELTLAADAVVDLGLLQPPERVKPQLRSGLSTSHGAWLRQASNVQSKGVYVGTIYSLSGPDCLPPLPAGKYVLEPFVRGAGYFGQFGVTGAPAGKPVLFALHADGTSTPSVVWPDGL
jgi:hypothetical protein